MKRLGLTCLAAAALLFATTALAAPRVVEGMPYAEARANLIADGARPVSIVRTEENSFACERDDGNWCERWPELEDCAGTGVAPCNFVFDLANGQRVVITTAGETDPRVIHFRPAD